MNISVPKLKLLLNKVLLSRYGKKDADLIVPVLLTAELAGIKSHGVIRLLHDKYSVMVNVGVKPEIVRESFFSKTYDIKGGNGMYAGAIACEEALKMVAKKGIAVVGTKNSFGSSGYLTYYAEKIAKKGFVAIVMAIATPVVAPFGSREKILGTNPMCYGFPKKKGVFIFDMATSAATRGALVRSAMLGENLPPGVAVDEEGEITTDPEKALKGALLNFGGYKGSGLAIVVEILAGVMTGADFGGFGGGEGWGNLFIVIDPVKINGDLDEFKEKVEKLIERIKTSKTIKGQETRIPGELELARRDKALKDGFVEVDDELISEIEKYLSTNN